MNHDFPKWEDLQRLRLNGFKPKKLEGEIIKEAMKFLPKHIFRWPGGVCTVSTPYGDYHWAYVVEMRQEQIWNFPEFREGYFFGLNPVEPFRDNNPYNELSRHRSWDCGYILGLHDHNPKVY